MLSQRCVKVFILSCILLFIGSNPQYLGASTPIQYGPPVNMGLIAQKIVSFNNNSYYAKYSLTLNTTHFYIYIASISGVILINQNQKDANTVNLTANNNLIPLGLYPNVTSTVDFVSNPYNEINPENQTNIQFTVNFQWYIVNSQQDLGRITSEMIVFNSSFLYGTINAPWASAWYQQPDLSTTSTSNLAGFQTIGDLISLILISALIFRYKRLRSKKL